MPRLALAGFLIYFSLVVGLRSWLQLRRTGSSGIHGVSGAFGSAEWLGGTSFVVALFAAVLAPIAELAGLVSPWHALATSQVHAAGIVFVCIGTAATLWSQLAMGDSWRIGVDPDERTALVGSGPFRYVRNPIFTSMGVGLGGLALLTPNVIAGVALLALFVALQLQVRRVEEPYLLQAHGDAYRRYAAGTGRFLPGIGRLALG